MQHSEFLKDGFVQAICKLKIMHNDADGSMQILSFGNCFFFVTFFDKYSRFAKVYP